MSNLKKILALVLALVMSFSLVSVSSAAFKDVDDVNAKYVDAIGVLSNLGVFNGRTATEFAPKADITRAEVAAIIYRVVTGDVAGKQVGIYADYNKFDDVNGAAWYAGYVNYCANAEYVKGVSATEFQPDAKVTGYQVLAMILRAVGYDKAGEFTGPSWDIQTAAVAKKLGVTKNVNDVTLNTYVSREVVAELLFRAINVPQVTYTLALGYNDKDAIVAGKYNPTLGYETFKLCSDVVDTYDKWGNPSYNWVRDYDKTGDATLGDINSTYGWSPVFTVAYPATAQYTTATKECVIAEAMGYKTNYEYDFDLKINGQDWTETFVNAVDTATVLGGQGRLTKVYEYYSKETNGLMRIITMVDTFLAEVTNVVPVYTDNAGHLKNYSELFLNVYDNGPTATALKVTLYNGKNWEYKVGDMVLVNGVTTGATQNGFCGDVTVTGIASANVLGLAESFVGAQTVIWHNQDKHTVNGVDYMDANTMTLDMAGVETTNHVWYKDTYGNIIGVDDVVTDYSYGVLSTLWWANDGSDMGKGSAYGIITYMDGTTSEVVKVASIQGLPTAYQMNTTVGADQANGKFWVSTYNVNNKALLNKDMYRIYTNANGSVALTEMAEIVDATVLTKVSAIAGTAGTVENYKYNSTTKAYDAVSVVCAPTVYADNFTQYLVYDVVTEEFTAYLGIDNVPKFDQKKAVVDYVNVDNDYWVDFVFIYGTSDMKHTSEFVYVTNPAYTETLKNNSVVYYTIYGVAHTDGTTTPIVTVDVDVKNALINGQGLMFLVDSWDGIATSATVVDANGVALTVAPKNWGEFEGTGAQYYSADGVNGVLRVDGEHYNVNAANTVVVSEDGIGTVYDLNQYVLTGKNVYVVSAANSNKTVAIAVFITDKTPATPDVDPTVAALLAELTAFTEITAENLEAAKAALAKYDELDAAKRTEALTKAYTAVKEAVEKFEAQKPEADDSVAKLVAKMNAAEVKDAETLAAAETLLNEAKAVEAEKVTEDLTKAIAELQAKVDAYKAAQEPGDDEIADLLGQLGAILGGLVNGTQTLSVEDYEAAVAQYKALGTADEMITTILAKLDTMVEKMTETQKAVYETLKPEAEQVQEEVIPAMMADQAVVVANAAVEAYKEFAALEEHTDDELLAINEMLETAAAYLAAGEELIGDENDFVVAEALIAKFTGEIAEEVAKVKGGIANTEATAALEDLRAKVDAHAAAVKNETTVKASAAYTNGTAAEKAAMDKELAAAIDAAYIALLNSASVIVAIEDLEDALTALQYADYEYLMESVTVSNSSLVSNFVAAVTALVAENVTDLGTKLTAAVTASEALKNKADNAATPDADETDITVEAQVAYLLAQLSSDDLKAYNKCIDDLAKVVAKYADINAKLQSITDNKAIVAADEAAPSVIAAAKQAAMDTYAEIIADTAEGGLAALAKDMKDGVAYADDDVAGWITAAKNAEAAKYAQVKIAAVAAKSTIKVDEKDATKMTLTLPAGVILTKENYATYVGIKAMTTVADGTETIYDDVTADACPIEFKVTIAGNVITVVTSDKEGGVSYESKTYTITVANETVTAKAAFTAPAGSKIFVADDGINYRLVVTNDTTADLTAKLGATLVAFTAKSTIESFTGYTEGTVTYTLNGEKMDATKVAVEDLKVGDIIIATVEVKNGDVVVLTTSVTLTVEVGVIA